MIPARTQNVKPRRIIFGRRPNISISLLSELLLLNLKTVKNCRKVPPKEFGYQVTLEPQAELLGGGARKGLHRDRAPLLREMVPPAGLEPATQGFSVLCSTN